MSRRRGYVEDPSIAKAAAVEAWEVWQRIERMCREGVPFFQAREIALAVAIPEITKSCGKETARRVSAFIQSKEPAEMSKETWRIIDRRLMRGRLRLMRYRERYGRMPWYDRLSCKIFGMPWRT